ncbi:hypothetical protein BD289DRAFT_259477 [Coniella lustricola]|uniref:Uncharacterized protein n=1 Tax=Coniella lustricola TaxID=2025994 RepID=A0A2T3A7X3_9PEZI|nr:hypothetical protein BD289DRAFT_259477 [Coniella lustricola]
MEARSRATAYGIELLLGDSKLFLDEAVDRPSLKQTPVDEHDNSWLGLTVITRHTFLRASLPWNQKTGLQAYLHVNVKQKGLPHSLNASTLCLSANQFRSSCLGPMHKGGKSYDTLSSSCVTTRLFEHCRPLGANRSYYRKHHCFVRYSPPSSCRLETIMFSGCRETYFVLSLMRTAPQTEDRNDFGPT